MTGRNPYAANPAPHPAGRGASGGKPKSKWVMWALIAAGVTLPCWLSLLIVSAPVVAPAAAGIFVVLVAVRVRRKKPARRVAVTPARRSR